MHRCIRDYDEGTGEDGEPNHIFPQSEHVKSEGAQDGGSGYFDVQSVLVIDQCEVFDLVDNKAFEAVMEDRQLDWKVSLGRIPAF